MDNGNEKPGYFAWLPPAVRYDPELPSTSKLIFAEISALTNLYGYCFATNAYLMALFEIGERTLQGHLKTLEGRGYIRIENGDGGPGRRRIFVNFSLPAQNPAENCGDPRKKLRGDPAENCGGNKRENRKDNNPPKPPKGQREKSPIREAPKWKPERFAGFWSFYPCHKSKQDAMRAWDQLQPSDELLATIAKALIRQKASKEWNREDARIPYAATYLRGARWEDEIDEPVREVDDSPWV